MKKSLFLVIVMFLLLIGVANGSENYVEDEILVKFVSGVDSARAQGLNASLGCRLLRKIPRINVLRLQIPPSTTVSEMISLYQEQPDVEYAEPNYLCHALTVIIPNDPYYEMQWHLPKIKVNEVWMYNRGSEDVIVAVVDTGLDLDHPDLDGQIISGYDFINGDSDPDDDNGHGSHMAGVIAAETNNGEGVTGINWYAKLMPVKVLDQDGIGPLSVLAQGIIFAADNGARVINLSLAAEETSQAMIDAVDYAYSKGCVLIAGTGNTGGAVMAPASLDKVIAVGATDEQDNWCDGSIWGEGSGSNHGAEIDVVAPGNNIVSAWSGDYFYYGITSGTSPATACVSGLAAMLISVNPRLSNVLVRSIITGTADDLLAEGWDEYTGYGRINVKSGIEVLRQVRPRRRFRSRWPFLGWRTPRWLIVPF